MATRDKRKWQHQRRQLQVYTDMHNRKWNGVVDTDSNGVVEITPRFSAPWLPDPKYFVFDDEARTITFDYDSMEQDILEARGDREDRRLELATQLYGDGAMAAMRNPPGQLRKIWGSEGLPIEFCQAARAGDPWVLGFTNVMPEAAKKFFVKKERVRVNPFASTSPFVSDANLMDKDDVGDVEGLLAGLGPEKDDDDLLDIEEQVDPEAVGGKTVKTSKRK